nr:MAG TPA: hypothetical protein [Caudoviricetes sp.]
MGLPPQTLPEGRLSLRLPSPLRGGLKKERTDGLQSNPSKWKVQKTQFSGGF